MPPRLLGVWILPFVLFDSAIARMAARKDFRNSPPCQNAPPKAAPKQFVPLSPAYHLLNDLLLPSRALKALKCHSD